MRLYCKMKQLSDMIERGMQIERKFTFVQILS
jgi:hypothetical protein